MAKLERGLNEKRIAENSPVRFSFFKDRWTQRELPSVIWDPEKKRASVEFDRRGNFETSDPKIADMLKRMGYKLISSSCPPEAAPVGDADVEL